MGALPQKDLCFYCSECSELFATAQTNASEAMATTVSGIAHAATLAPPLSCRFPLKISKTAITK